MVLPESFHLLQASGEGWGCGTGLGMCSQPGTLLGLATSVRSASAMEELCSWLPSWGALQNMENAFQSSENSVCIINV